VIFPDVMRWLWRDYPAPVARGVSRNSTLQEITLPGEEWRQIPQRFQQARALAADAKGDVYFSDALALRTYRLAGDGAAALFQVQPAAVVGQAFGPDGTLYGVVPGAKRVIATNAQGQTRTIAEGIAARGIVVTHAGDVYVSEASRIWRIRDGRKELLDEAPLSASGVAFSPDGGLFYAAEENTKWIYSYVVQPDGKLIDKQQFYWLHTSDVAGDSGAQNLALDTHGNLYVATSIGIQVCDQNGRVRAILPLPSPAAPLRGICFGGEHFDVLYATDGERVFSRRMKLSGFAPWAAPIAVRSQGAG
jgi:sugar lactone lactonase YvrE